MTETSIASCGPVKAEVTASLDTLAQLLDPELFDTDEPSLPAGPFCELTERLGGVAVIASECGFFGLGNFVALFQAKLADIADRGRPLDPALLDLLLEWPGRMIEYLDSPQESKSGHALVDLLSRPEWVEPITEDQATALREQLESTPADGELFGREGPFSQDCSERDDDNSDCARGFFPLTARDSDGLASTTGSTAGRATTQKEGADVWGDPDGAATRPSALEGFHWDGEDRFGEASITAAVHEERRSTGQHAVIPLRRQRGIAARRSLDSPPSSANENPDGGTDLTAGRFHVGRSKTGVIADRSAPSPEATRLNAADGGETLSSLDPASLVEDLDAAKVHPPLEEHPIAPFGTRDRAAEECEAPMEPSSVSQTHLSGSRCEPPASSSVEVPLAEGFESLGEALDIPAVQEGTLLQSGPYERDKGSEPNATEYDDAAEVDIPSAQVNRELVALLEAEVRELQATIPAALGATDPGERSSLLGSVAELTARVSEAAATVGMSGLAQVLAHIASNLGIFAEDATACDASVLELWPESVLAYLSAPGVPRHCQDLVACLDRPGWAIGLEDGRSAELAEELCIALTDTVLDSVERRPSRATDEDISLAIPQDINPEVLQSLLVELPALTAEFTAAIHRLSDGEGSLDDLTTAQRAAHTLKGASNTVGVTGIAVLAHHVEDILQAMAKQGAFRKGPLAECLIDSADCLEMMAEALLGMCEAPAEAKAVLQLVLDWANWIDANGLPAGEELAPVNTSLTAGDKGGTNADAAWFAATPVPAASPTRERRSQDREAGPIAAGLTSISQADELLRLSGELNTLHGQVTNRFERVREDVTAWQQQGNVLQQLAIELEQMVDIRGISWSQDDGRKGGAFDSLEMEQYNELHTLSRRLIEAVSDSRELGQEVHAHFDSMKHLLIAQSRLQRDNDEAVLRMRMLPAQTLVARLQRSLRQTCRVAGKNAFLQVIGVDTLIDSEVLNALADPLMHLLRNAIDHGIELPQDRVAANKSESGSITLEFGRTGNHIMIRCRDDGAGLDFEAVRRKAEQQGLIQPEQPLSKEELARLILMPGFSTRDISSQLSGRGIGMDAVHHAVQALKGSVQLRSEAGAGLTVELLLPASLLSSHSLLVRTGGQRIAISSHGVEQILPPGAGELRRVGDYDTYKVGEDVYETFRLQALLHTETPVDETCPRPALLVRDSAGVRRAVLVEEVLESRTLVVKSMSEYVPPLRGVVGATILGDGSVAPVIDLEALLVEPVLGLRGKALTEIPEAREPRQLKALIVDDSLSARRSMTQLFEDAGFEVETALDGVDAIAEIQKALPDLMIVDLEMPRMDGLELTRHLRGHAATRQLPVIMVTSRSTDKHRSEAWTAGVNAYVNKPYNEDDLMRIVSELTALRGAA